MPIAVECAKCGGTFHAEESQAEGTVPCPSCQEPLTIRGKRVSRFDVFISHSTKNSDAAQAVCHALEARGVRCWMAPRDVPSGKKWAEAIVDAVSDSRILLLLLSNDSIVSEQVMNEVGQAANHRIPILPVRLEEVELTAELSFFISRSHWMDAFPPPLAPYLNRLVDDVCVLISDEGASKRKALTPDARRKKGWRDYKVYAGMSLITLCCALLFSWMIFGSRDAGNDPARMHASLNELARKIESVDRGEGFGKRIEQLTARHRKFAKRLEEGTAEGDDEEFRSLRPEMQKLLNDSALRDSSKQRVARIEALREQGLRLGLAREAGGEWDAADGAYQSGLKSLDGENFVKAEQELSIAESAFVDLVALEAVRNQYDNLHRLAIENGYPAEVVANADQRLENRTIGDRNSESTAYREAFELLHAGMKHEVRAKTFDLAPSVFQLGMTFRLMNSKFAVMGNVFSLDNEARSLERRIAAMSVAMGIRGDTSRWRREWKEVQWEDVWELIDQQFTRQLKDKWGEDVASLFELGLGFNELILRCYPPEKYRSILKRSNAAGLCDPLDRVIAHANQADISAAFVKKLEAIRRQLSDANADTAAIQSQLLELAKSIRADLSKDR